MSVIEEDKDNESFNEADFNSYNFLALFKYKSLRSNTIALSLGYTYNFILYSFFNLWMQKLGFDIWINSIFTGMA